MRSFINFLSLLFLLAACKSGEAKVEATDSSDLLDSTELKMKADTARSQIMHIGDSLEHMQRQAESNARKAEH